MKCVGAKVRRREGQVPASPVGTLFRERGRAERKNSCWPASASGERRRTLEVTLSVHRSFHYCGAFLLLVMKHGV